MRLGRFGSLELYIVRRHSVRRAGSRAAALEFLKRFESNPLAIERLRDFLTERGANGGASAGEGEPLERIADLMAAEDVFFGPGDCEPYWRHDSSRSRSAALTFLGQLKTSSEAIRNLRSFVSSSRLHSDLSRVRDEQILGHVAEWIATGEVLVGFRRLLLGGGGVAEEAAGASTPRQDAAAARQARGGASGAAGRSSDKDSTDKAAAKTWIEIRLVDAEDKPVPNQKYRIKMTDGSVKEGSLDGEGRARFEQIDPGNCEVSFPEIDAQEWKPA
jgi:hypothetical protein